MIPIVSSCTTIKKDCSISIGDGDLKVDHHPSLEQMAWQQAEEKIINEDSRRMFLLISLTDSTESIADGASDLMIVGRGFAVWLADGVRFLIALPKQTRIDPDAEANVHRRTSFASDDWRKRRSFSWKE